MLHLIKPGDHIIAGLELYGGTQTLMKHHANYVGIEVDFVDSTDVLSVKNAIKPNTKVNNFFRFERIFILKVN